MFFSLATLYPVFPVGGPRSLFRVHPTQLSYWLDEVWATARRTPPIPGRDPNSVFSFLDDTVLDALDLPTQPSSLFLQPSGLSTDDPLEWTGEPGPDPLNCPPRLWHHLAYAYLIESTGIVEIFTEVVRRLVTGETLGTLKPESIAWVRATEQLFFREPPPFAIHGVLSTVRPSDRTNRRNAYWRMFGMDLAHPVPPTWAQPGPFADWKAHTGPVNEDFRPKWTEFLRQVWLGVENERNNSGPNTADPSFIALLAVALRDMLRNRRRGGALAREEFAYVAMASWFHLTVSDDTQLVQDLQAQASSPGDRLASIAQRVGMSPALRARELFDLAEPMSTVLRGIEAGLFDTPASAETLFRTGTKLATDMVNLINNWQSATGERVKERPTGTVAVAGAQPLRVPVPGNTTPSAVRTAEAVPATVNGNRG
ncbi:hypothetical protein OHA21_17690 [Actinoplanes sp. NBC_00393]|uniref:hypothetical protein n=1 Tax=Actinoplanes sp. NBC_00393 TaxID=2975953 RepID=UPI002E22F1B7